MMQEAAEATNQYLRHQEPAKKTTDYFFTLKSSWEESPDKPQL